MHSSIRREGAIRSQLPEDYQIVIAIFSSYVGLFLVSKMFSGGAKPAEAAPAAAGTFTVFRLVCCSTLLLIFSFLQISFVLVLSYFCGFLILASGGGGAIPSFEDDSWPEWIEQGDNLAKWESSLE